MANEVAKTTVLETCKIVLEGIVEDIVFMCHGIVYHVSMRGANDERLRKLGFINVLLPYLKSHKDIVKIPCLATLANIVNEKECDIIKADIRCVSHLLDVMTDRLSREDRTYEGWSCKECVIEADYAYHQRKPIIPLKMEQGYKQDGWLGILIGEKYFLDFSGKYDFNDKVKDFFREIRGTLEKTSLKTPKALSLKVNETFLPTQREEIYTPKATTIRNRENVNVLENIRLTRQWTEADVSNWLTNQGIDDITGEEVSLLAKMHVEAPERMYKCIKRELELTSLLARSRLVWALYELTKS